MDYNTFKSRITKRIRELRQEKGMTQEEVSGLTMGLRTYSRIESGDNAPNLESIFNIAMALGIHPKEILSVSMDEERAKRR